MRIKRLLLALLFTGTSLSSHAQNGVDSVKTLLIKVETGLQFDLVRFTVKPGQKVRIVFENTDDMDHNLLITMPGAREEVVTTALQLAEKGPAMNFIPKSPKILWSIPVIAPDQKGTVEFTAPEKAGVYPYVCTYPGHGFLMYGAMYVNSTGKMPKLKDDRNIPESRRAAPLSEGEKHDDMHAGHQMPPVPKPLHPYTPISPYLYRVFIEGASPAAIAVSLPDSLSYCWDAGTCRLRFAWHGGFLDNSDLWKGKGDALAKVVGHIFFTDQAFPFRIGKSEKLALINYKGYTLIDRYPEFHYTVNGVDIYEMIRPTIGTIGLVRTFRIPDAGADVVYLADQEDTIVYKSSAGQWKNGQLQLNAAEARQFKVTMTIKKEMKHGK